MSLANLEQKKSFLSEERAAKVEQVAKARTKNVTVLLEKIHDGHNQSAVLRTCDAFGLSEVHILNNDNKKFKPSKKITQGVFKWLKVHQHNDPKQAVSHLKDKGFRVFASRLDERTKPLLELDMTGQVALVFGNEHQGISQEIADECDETFMIPMVGFSQSFNVSVAAAISLYEVFRQRIKKYGQNGDLNPEETKALHEHYLNLSLDL